MKYNGIGKIGIILISLLVPVFTIIACSQEDYSGEYVPGIDIKVHNQTDETLQIFIWEGEEYLKGTVNPGKVLVFGRIRDLPWSQLIAKDMDGNEIYSVIWHPSDYDDNKTYYDVYLPPNN